MYCPNCGEMLPEGARFCGVCGSMLAESVITNTGDAKTFSSSSPQVNAASPEAEDMPAGSAQDSPDSCVPQAQIGQPIAGKSRKNNVLPILLIAVIVVVIIAVNVIIVMMPTDEEKWQEQYNLGQQYLLELDYEQAIVAFTAAIEIDENNVEAYIGRAEAYIGDDVSDASEENLILALSDYETALSIDDTMAQVYADRGQVYQTLGSMEEALSDYNAALSLDESLLEIYACRGHVYLALGDSEAAMNDYETAVELDAADEEVFLCAAQICMDQGDYDQAAEFLEKGGTAYPDSEDIRELADEVGAILEEEEKRKRYQLFYDKLMELQEDYGEISYSYLGWDYFEGLCFASLLDFDSNGYEELILAYFTGIDEWDMAEYTVEIWEYADGTIKKIFEGEPTYTNGGCYYIEISGLYGTYYFLQSSEFSQYVWGYDGTEFTLVQSNEFSWDTYDMVTEGTTVFDEDGADLSEKYYADYWLEYSGMEETEEELENTLKILMDYLGIESDGAMLEELSNQTGKESLYIKGSGEGYYYLYEYDAYGNCLLRNFYLDDALSSYEAYFYDESGNLVLWINYDLDGTLNNWCVYLYDSQGKRTASTTYDADGMVYAHSEYEYDSDGYLTVVYNKSGTYRSVYTDGNLTASYSYDESGNLERYTIYETNDVGNRSAYTSYYADGTAWAWAEFEYVYDEEGYCLMCKVSYESSIGDFSDSYVEEYSVVEVLPWDEAAAEAGREAGYVLTEEEIAAVINGEWLPGTAS